MQMHHNVCWLSFRVSPGTLKTNITIKQMLIHWIRRFTEPFQIHFRKHLSSDQVSAHIFLRVTFLCCYLVQRPLQGLFFLKTKTCPFSVATASCTQHAFHCHIITLRYHMPLPSAGSIINYYRVLTGSNIPPALQTTRSKWTHFL